MIEIEINHLNFACVKLYCDNKMESLYYLCRETSRINLGIDFYVYFTVCKGTFPLSDGVTKYKIAILLHFTSLLYTEKVYI